MYNLPSRYWFFYASVILRILLWKTLDTNTSKIAFRQASTHNLIFPIFHQCSKFENAGNCLFTFYWKRRTFFINKKWTFKIILHIIKYAWVSDNLIISYPRIRKCNIIYLRISFSISMEYLSAGIMDSLNYCILDPLRYSNV